MGIRPAAAVILSRGDQIWLGHRGDTRFLPGFCVFPGGACEPGESFEEAAHRELTEETGLKLPQAGELLPFSRAITPAYSHYRYDVRVYRVEISPDQEPQADGFEFCGGAWYTAAQALQLRDRGELQLAPPTYRQLLHWQACLMGAEPWPEESAAFNEPDKSHEEILPFAPGITVIPLRTQSMPPAAWTNSCLLGERHLYILDPGGPQVEALRAELEKRLEQGAELKGVILSHHHPDHTDGYHALELAHLPLYCHPLTAPLLPKDFPASRPLHDGDFLSIEDGLTLLAHFTPGHAPGHLAFQLPERKTLLAGDMISSLSSIVIPSDNGSLTDYLHSLDRLRKLDCHLVIPSHGPPYGRGSDPFGTAISHREKRESQVLHLLSQAPQSVDDITQTLYRGLDHRLMPAARANVSHHLWKLRAEGVVKEDNGAWIKIVADGSS